MALWNGLSQAATVAQLAGVDAGGLITMIVQAVQTVRRNREECQHLMHHVMMIGDLLQMLQQSETMQRPEIRRPLDGLEDTLRQAYTLVVSCQQSNTMYRFLMAGTQAQKFRDIRDRIDSYLGSTFGLSLVEAGESLTQGPLPCTAVHAHRRLQKRRRSHLGAMSTLTPGGLTAFKFSELARSTNNFSSNNIIGSGGFGNVYKAWDLWSSGRAMELIDLWSSLHDEPQMNSILRCIQIALLCVQRNWADRPTMADVLFMLKCETMTLPVPGPPAAHTSGPVLSGGSANTSGTASSTTYASAESDD
ncbi:unnamed protein product [Miscanthus lutarioriparius]|uniref:MCAfunc domain-containing protein n=1 Tax=Miscanthus lutarioriparius TaxID=422564 RepID=A0A811PXJ6_9POAL|nr:unnamed protein product [Miscanthus lutarioriparius]